MTDKFALHFDIVRLIHAERLLGTKISDIVAEVQSPTGLSLATLRVLIAVGEKPDQLTSMMQRMTGRFDLQHDALAKAGRTIERRGIAACSTAVGEALGRFLAAVNREEAA